jgi:uncharacterized protein YecT (DUF1311 family)
MKLTISLAFALLASQVCRAQGGWSGSVGSDSGVMITVESKLEPPKPDLAADELPEESGVKWLKTKTAGAVGMMRYSRNTKTHEYFGYEVVAEPIPQAGTYRVTFSALTFEDLAVSPSGWRMLPTPIFPSPQIVGSTDTIALDLFENPATGQKIVDYLRIKRDNCDSQTGQGHVPCLVGLVRDAQRSLEAKLKVLESTRDGGEIATLKDSQEAWEKYREQACATFKDEAKRLQCELTLLRNRTRELGEIY